MSNPKVIKEVRQAVVTDDERLERVLAIDGDRTFYVEARVGSANYRGGYCRVLWRDARNNEPADELILLLVAEVRRLRAAVAAERERAAKVVESHLPADDPNHLTAWGLERAELLASVAAAIRQGPLVSQCKCATGDAEYLACPCGVADCPACQTGEAVVSDSDRGPATADGQPWKGV